MRMAAGLTRRGPVPAVLLFMPDPGLSRARVVFVEGEVEARPDTVFALIEAQVTALTGCEFIAREDGAMLTVSLPAPVPGLVGQRTVLTLTVERRPGGRCVLGLTHAGFGRGDDWDAVFGTYAAAWPEALALLKAEAEHANADIRG